MGIVDRRGMRTSTCKHLALESRSCVFRWNFSIGARAFLYLPLSLWRQQEIGWWIKSVIRRLSPSHLQEPFYWAIVWSVASFSSNLTLQPLISVIYIRRTPVYCAVSNPKRSLHSMGSNTISVGWNRTHNARISIAPISEETKLWTRRPSISRTTKSAHRKRRSPTHRNDRHLRTSSGHPKVSICVSISKHLTSLRCRTNMSLSSSTMRCMMEYPCWANGSMWSMSVGEEILKCPFDLSKFWLWIIHGRSRSIDPCLTDDSIVFSR